MNSQRDLFRSPLLEYLTRENINRIRFFFRCDLFPNYSRKSVVLFFTRMERMFPIHRLVDSRTIFIAKTLINFNNLI